MTVHRPTMLLILDGWGWREGAEDNAIRQARTPNFDRLWSSYPHAFLRTSGLDVGLPEGQMGNSEVGHLNLGAGRVVMQDLPRINQAIADGSISQVTCINRSDCAFAGNWRDLSPLRPDLARRGSFPSRSCRGLGKGT